MFLKIQLLKNTLEEVSNKAERKVKGKSKEKGNGKEKGKGKDKGKSKKKSTEKEIKPGEIEFDQGKKQVPYTKEQCTLKVDIIHQFAEHHIFFDLFSAVTNLDGHIRLPVDESNLYALQNGIEFHPKEQEMRAFLGIKYIISINKLPTIKSYWECGQFIGNEGIRNVMARSRLQDILRNLHFSDNTEDDKSDRRLQSQMPYQPF